MLGAREACFYLLEAWLDMARVWISPEPISILNLFALPLAPDTSGNFCSIMEWFLDRLFLASSTELKLKLFLRS